VGLKFRRQVPLGPYVVDFACYAARLVVEVDGPGHDASVDRDAARDCWLEARGSGSCASPQTTSSGGPEAILVGLLRSVAPSAGSDGYITGRHGRGFYDE
jgi:hypothetical protein